MIEPQTLQQILVYGGAGAVLTVVGLAVGWLTHFHPAPTLAPAQPMQHPIDLNTALDIVLVKAMDSQAGMLERMQTLNVENARMAMEQLQLRRAKRGGFKRAATGQRRANGTYQKECRLCEDTSISDPTPAEIVLHSSHRRRRAHKPHTASSSDAQTASIDDAQSLDDGHVDEQDVIDEPNGGQRVECGDCGEPKVRV